MASTLPIAWYNGEFLPIEEARISPLDRGFLFADGVYEVIPVYGGRLFRFDEHLDRLQYSLEQTRIRNPMTRADWHEMLDRLVERNGGGNLAVYFQVTRGATSGRDHRFPEEATPTVFAMASPLTPADDATWERGVRVVTMDDIRWHRCDIKAIALLANVLLRQAAEERGGDEALLVRNGRIVECSASSVFAVIDGTLVTPPKGPDLLPGITRDLILELAGEDDIPFRERALDQTELDGADEVLVASSTRELMPVVRIDNRPVGDGRPGPVTRRLRSLFQAYRRQLENGDAREVRMQ